MPGSHDGPLYDQCGEHGNWTGALRDQDVAALPLDRVACLEGPAGSITVHNCRAVRGSLPSERADGRPLLINAYTGANAFPHGPHPSKSTHSGEIVRGPAWCRGLVRGAYFDFCRAIRRGPCRHVRNLPAIIGKTARSLSSKPFLFSNAKRSIDEQVRRQGGDRALEDIAR